MHRLLGLVALIAIVFASGCSGRVKASETYEQDAAWGQYTKLRVETHNGSVTVKQGGTETVSIRGEKWARGATIEEAEQRLSQVQVVAEPAADAPDTLAIRVETATQAMRRYSGASVEIAVPDTCDVHVRTANGGVRIEEMTNADVKTSNGSVAIRKSPGDVLAESSNGSLLIEDVQGTVKGETSNGRITLRNLHGAIEARTNNGRIVAEGIETVTGNVIFRTSNGSITATLSKDISAAVDVSTSNGSIQVDTSGMQVAGTSASKRRYEAKLNGGEHTVEAKTSNGSVKLKFE